MVYLLPLRELPQSRSNRNQGKKENDTRCAIMTRFIEPLLTPLGILWALNLIVAIRCISRKEWRPALFCGGTVVLLFAFGSTSIPYRLLASLERPYGTRQWEAQPSADAIVMLGGILNRSEFDPLGFDAGSAFDRVLGAAELMRLGKAPTLVIGGGGGHSIGPNGKPWIEAEVMQGWFRDWNLGLTNVLHLKLSANTREEALQIKELAAKHGWKKIILMTSASHMKRAEALFRKLDIPVKPIACDFVGLSSLSNKEPFSPFPKALRLYRLDLFLHEWIGWHYYRLRGWI